MAQARGEVREVRGLVGYKLMLAGRQFDRRGGGDSTLRPTLLRFCSAVVAC